MNYSVKNVKSWQGTDGVGTECTLYRDGKKVARCLDEGCGGEMHFYWADYKEPRVDITVTISDYDAPQDENGKRPEKQHTYKGTPEEKLLAEFANAQQEEAYGMTLRKDGGWIVSDLCDAYDRAKQERKIAKKLKTHTGFVVMEKGEEVTYTLNRPYSPVIAAQLKTKYGDSLVKILNEELAETA